MKSTSFKHSTDILIHDYETRKRKNASYSKRAYAMHLEISSGRLADLMNRKCHMSVKTGLLIVSKFALSEEHKETFMWLLENECQARPDNRRTAKVKTGRRLHIDEFAIISDWEYFTFLALVETKTFKNEMPWIAKKMGITQERAQVVVDHLHSLKYITIDEKGKIANSHGSISTMTDVPSEVLRKANIECIMQGIDKIHTTDIQKRDVTSLTFPVSQNKMKELKALIREFKTKATALMDKEPTSDVYNLNIQLVPVTDLDVP